MSLSINESVDLIQRCKGNWLSVEHYILPNKPMKDNEKYGYCSICWENDFKENRFSPNPEDITKVKSYSDSKINSNFVQCGKDTL